MDQPRQSMDAVSRNDGTIQSVRRSAATLADLGRLLALDRREGADAPLALQPQHALVEAPGQEHGAVQALAARRGESAGSRAESRLPSLSRMDRCSIVNCGSMMVLGMGGRPVPTHSTPDPGYSLRHARPGSRARHLRQPRAGLRRAGPGPGASQRGDPRGSRRHRGQRGGRGRRPPRRRREERGRPRRRAGLRGGGPALPRRAPSLRQPHPAEPGPGLERGRVGRRPGRGQRAAGRAARSRRARDRGGPGRGPSGQRGRRGAGRPHRVLRRRRARDRGEPARAARDRLGRAAARRPRAPRGRPGRCSRTRCRGPTRSSTCSG